METFIQEITNQEIGYRQVSEATSKTYSENLGKLHKLVTESDVYPDDHLWLKDYDKVIETLDDQDYAASTYRNYLAVISVVLQPKERGTYRDTFEATAKKYISLLAIKKADALELAEQQKLSSTDKEKWVTTKELIKVRQGYAKELRLAKFNLGKTGVKGVAPKKYIEILQMYLVSSLYTMDFSNRNVYGKMKIITGDKYRNMLHYASVFTHLQHNYLVIDKKGKKQIKFFSMGDTKTSWKKVAGKPKEWNGLVKIDIHKDLNKVINLWLKYKPYGEWLLIGKNGGKPMGRNGLSKFIGKTFKATGKKVGSNIIRKVKNTEEFANDSSIKHKQEVAKKSGHSVATQQLHYTKHIMDSDDSDSQYGTIGFPANSLNDCPFCGYSGCNCGSGY